MRRLPACIHILVIGHSGQLATELRRARWPIGSRVVALGKEQLDLSDGTAVASAIATAKPDMVVNAAAYTAVDRAETERDAAFAVNAAGPEHLAIAAARRDVPLIHISTDYVFSGAGLKPWTEDDEPDPRSAYGRSKLAGEEAVRAVSPKHVILRTSWLFASHGHNFVRAMLRLGRERDTLRIVDDQRGCPTETSDLARVIVEIASALLRGNARFGTYHYAGEGALTWYEFGQAIFANAGDLVARPPLLLPISTAEYAAPAARPANSVLACGKIARDFDVSRAAWAAGLQKVLDEIRTGAAAG